MQKMLEKKEIPKQAFSCEIREVFKNTYFEDNLQTTASKFIGVTTLFHETILKKNIQMEETIFKMAKSITGSNILSDK